MYLTIDIMKKLRLILSFVISLVLFAGGLVLFLSRSSFWSLFLGIPAVQIGIVFLIFTYDRLSKDELDDEMNDLLRFK